MSAATGWRGFRLLVLALAPLAFLLGACIPTTSEYPVDYFNEMHYQQSYRRQEPPRLSAPDSAVPYVPAATAVPGTGAEGPYTDAQLAQMKNPLQTTPDTLREAGVLYQRNCLPCHGPQGKGDGIVAGYFKSPQYQATARVPKPYDDPTVVAMSDGQLYGIITNGLRDEQTLVGMPAFRKMLTDRERWLLVQQIRAFQGQR